MVEKWNSIFGEIGILTSKMMRQYASLAIEFPFLILTFCNSIQRMWMSKQNPKQSYISWKSFEMWTIQMAKNVRSLCCSMANKMYFFTFKKSSYHSRPYEIKASFELSTSIIRSYCIYFQPFDVIIAIIQS